MALKARKKTLQPEVMLDINTTPLIDVMLVLLIMLIITIPVQLHKVDLDLPVPVQSPPPQEEDLPAVRIRIAPDSTVLWNDQAVDPDELDRKLAEVAARAKAPELHIHPDRAASYARVVAVMAAIQRHGLDKIGLVGTEQFLQ